MIRVVAMLLLIGGLLVLMGITRPRMRVRRSLTVSVHPLVGAGAALGCGSLALLVTAIPIVAVLAFIGGMALPFAVQRRRLERRRRDTMQAWPSVIDDITSGVSAGLDLPEALAHAAVRAPVGVQSLFHTCARRYAISGDFRASLLAMQTSSPDPVLDQLTQALVLARETGGRDLTHVLRSLGAFVRADLHLRGEIDARQSWSVNSARMAVAAPWIVLVMLAARPSTAEAYRSMAGGLVLLGIAVVSALAYAVMLRIASLDTA